MPTPTVLMYGRRAGARRVFRRADVVTREMRGRDGTSRRTCPRERPTDERDAAWEATRALVRAMNAAGVRHHDLNVKNVLLAPSDGGLIAHVLDVDRVEFGARGRRAPPRGERAARLLRSARKWRDERGATFDERELALGRWSRAMSAPLVVAVEASRLAQERARDRPRGVGPPAPTPAPAPDASARAPRAPRGATSTRSCADGSRRSARRSTACASIRAGGSTACRADLFWYPWNVALPAPRRGVVVATIQDVAPLVLPDPRRRKLLKNLRWRRRYRLTAKRADAAHRHLAVHARRGASRARLSDVADPRDAARRGRSRDPAGRRATRRRWRGSACGRRIVLAVGAADRRKNLGLLERAMPRVAETNPARDARARRPAARRRPRDPAWQRTLGFVSDEDLMTLYRCARVAVAPSSYEGFGLPLLEAMQLGTPVIAARASSLPEVGGDAAVYVEPDDDAALATEIQPRARRRRAYAALRAASLAQSRAILVGRDGARDARRVRRRVGARAKGGDADDGALAIRALLCCSPRRSCWACSSCGSAPCGSSAACSASGRSGACRPKRWTRC